MADLNRVFLAGNLTRDPEVRYTPEGRAVADLGLAVNRRYRTPDGENREEVCYVSVVVWGRQAETSGEYLSKGSPVLIEGRLHYDQWEKDGQKFSRLRVVANRVQFLSSPRSGSGGGQAQPVDQSASQPVDQSAEQMSNSGGADSASSGEDGGDDDNLPF